LLSDVLPVFVGGRAPLAVLEIASRPQHVDRLDRVALQDVSDDVQACSSHALPSGVPASIRSADTGHVLDLEDGLAGHEHRRRDRP
jgi:hypothetical protein